MGPDPGETRIPGKYLLFVGSVSSPEIAKTAFGIAHWRAQDCVGQLRLSEQAVDLGLPDLDLVTAKAQGARTLIVAVASIGGVIDPDWVPLLVEALESGLDLAAGLHQKLAAIPALAEAARANGRKLYDVRAANIDFPTATGRKRSGLRLLTVGSDCGVGKKYSALAIEAALRQQGVAADFRATGQTGVMIAGRGVAIDAVVADFVAGAAEWLTPDADPDHWDVIEGQGALGHPAYAGVSLGLLHGSQPDAIVLCHDVSRRAIYSVPGFPLPSLPSIINTNLHLARLTNPDVVAVGVCLNTQRLSDEEADAAVSAIEQETGLPCCDPVRHGAGKIATFIVGRWGGGS